MEVDQVLTKQYQGKEYVDGQRVITVSHVNRIDGPNGSYLTVFYNADEPEIGRTGQGSCFLDYLQGLPEVR